MTPGGVSLACAQGGLELCDDEVEGRSRLMLEALEGALDGVLHLRRTRDEFGVPGPGSDGDDEAVLVADGHLTHSMKATGE